MTQKEKNTDNSKIEINGLLNIYKQAVKNVHLLKYSWILIATICILSLAAYFKLKNSDVFFYALLVIIISFFGFLFSYLLKTKDRFIKVLLYGLLTSIVITMATAVLGFGSFMIWEKPGFYGRWFPNHSVKNIQDHTKEKNSRGKESSKNVADRIMQKNTGSQSNDNQKTPAKTIPTNKNLKLAQFEIQGSESASPVLNVKLQNTGRKDIVITRVLYRISNIEQIKEGNSYRSTESKAKYKHVLTGEKGNREFPLNPSLRIAANSTQSFSIQIKTDKQDKSLCLLMSVYFLASNEESVSSDEFQLIIAGNSKASPNQRNIR